MFLTHFQFPLFAWSIYCTLFWLDCFDLFMDYMSVCIFHYFNYDLLDFVTAICLRFIFGFSFLGICVNPIKCHNKPPVESLFWTRDQALSLQNGSIDSKTLDNQRTPNLGNIKQWKSPQRQPLVCKTWHHPYCQQHPVQDASSKQQTRQKWKPNLKQTRLPPHSALPIRGKKKKKKKKKAAQISLYTKLTETNGPTLGGQKPKGGKNSTLKPGKRRLQI